MVMSNNNIKAQFSAQGQLLTSDGAGTPGIIAAGNNGNVILVDTGVPLQIRNGTPNINGTYAPVVHGSSAAGTATYSTQTGIYSLITNLCLVWVTVDFSAFTGTGDLQITLPFTIGASSQSSVCGTSTFDGTFTSGTNIAARGSAGNQFVILSGYGSSSAVQTQQCVSSANITFSVFYTLD